MKYLKMIAALLIFIVIMFTSVSCLVVAKDDNGRHRGWNNNSNSYRNSNNRNYRDNRGNRDYRESDRNDRSRGKSATIVIRSK